MEIDFSYKKRINKDIRAVLASNLSFVASIIPLIQLLLLVAAEVSEGGLSIYIFISIPFVAAAVENWITFGTARWGDEGIKVGGMIVGKIFSIIYIGLYGMLALFISGAALLWSSVAAIIGQEWNNMVYEQLGGYYTANDISLGSGFGLGIGLLCLIPVVFGIVFQARLVILRNLIIQSVDNQLSRKPKTVFTSVLSFLLGIPIVFFCSILIVACVQAIPIWKESTWSVFFVAMVLALSVVASVVKGILLIKIGYEKK